MITPTIALSHYRTIHRHLFQDAYSWAGKIRDIRIAKDGNWFCYPENIDGQMETLFRGLAKANHFSNLSSAAFAKKTAHFLAELNAIHPFREGNGRTQLSFLTLLAERAGHPLHLDRLDPDAIMEATIASFDSDEKGLEAVITGLL